MTLYPLSRRWPWAVALFVLLVAAAFTVWFVWLRRPASKPDPVAATQANLRGVGHMERFDYAAAVKDFEEVVRLDPDWLPGQVNLAIALFHNASNFQDQRRPEFLKRSAELFRKVLQKDPDNRHAHYGLGLIYMEEGRLPEANAEFETMTRLDPNDAYSWYLRGQTQDSSPEGKRFYRRALDLNPYLNSARLGLAHHAFEYDEQKSKDLLDEFTKLKDAQVESLYNYTYTERGPY